MPHYRRTVDELRAGASMFWPPELSQKESELSVIPKLLETQDQFIAILSVDVETLDGLFQIVNSSTLPGNMFLKHHVVLADFGGEMLQRINSQFSTLFPSGTLEYLRSGERQFYTFSQLPIQGSLNNNRLGISGRKLLEKRSLDPLTQDVIALLLWGSLCSDERVAQVLNKCEIGNLLGKHDRLERYIRQRYIWVSRITSGSQSNELGQIAQAFVKEYIETEFRGQNLEIKANGHLPDVTHADAQSNRLTTFDIVVTNGQRYAAVEVSFQVTTNSVIERKAGQARSRYEQIERGNHKIAYVLDGAGNFERETALSTLCSYSHCTVAFSRSELGTLCDFLKETFSLNHRQSRE